MNSRERIEAALRLEVPDRVPIFPLMIFFPARHAGVPTEVFMEDKGKYRWASEVTFSDFGGWDGVLATGGIDSVTLAFLHTLKTNLPGRELPSDALYQLVEEPLMAVEDYDLLLEKGWGPFFGEMLCRVRPDLFRSGPTGMAEIQQAQERILAGLIEEIAHWRKKGAEPVFGGIIKGPFTHLSEFRSLEELVLDLYRRPEQVLAALEAVTEGVIEAGKGFVKATGIRRIFVGEVRSSAAFLSLKFFERFSLPFLRQIAEAFVDEEIVPIFHLDSNWTRNLPYLRQLPARRCAVMFDGCTDIFQAKKILGDHLCLIGDVPATLLTLGTPQEVEGYVRKLIAEVGRGGGFILCSGCELPINAREENVQAMIESGRTWGVYRR